MSRNLFIPSKIRVGFQKRNDTFTGKLAYVIYYDEKGKIRKETSWNSWCNGKIEVLEIDNDPRNGYIFNKGVKRDGYWGSGRSVIRVYDPRDFEFEISVDNLIGLLMHSDVSKRDIVEECVFAWWGADLVLLPTNSQEYIDSIEYTNKQSMKVSARDLVLGRQYGQKKHSGILTYIGRHPWYVQDSEYLDGGRRKFQKFKGKKHIFADGSGNFYPNPAVSLSHEISDNVVGDIAFLVDKYIATDSAQKIVDITLNTNPVYAGNDNDYCNSTEMCKVEQRNGEPVYIKIHAYCHYSNGVDTFDLDQYNLSIYTHKRGIDADGCVEFQSLQERHDVYHHYHETDFARDLRITKETLKINLRKHLVNIGLDTKVLTKPQIFDGLVHLGFGELTAILENGDTFKYNL